MTNLIKEVLNLTVDADNYEELIEKIKEINKYYLTYISHFILDKNTDNITKNIFTYGKFVKTITKKYYKISNEKLHEVITEALTILRAINFQYNVICYEQRYITQFEKMLSEKDIRKIIKIIYNTPDISFDELNKLNIINSSKYLSYLLERLVDVDMIHEFNNYYEITYELSKYIQTKGDNILNE